jgi:hypothetical protein
MENTNQKEQQGEEKDATKEQFSTRYFRRTIAGGWKSFPLSKISKIYFKDLAMPEMANQRMEVVEVVVEMKKGDPIRIRWMLANTWTFRSDGVLDHEVEFAKTVKNINTRRNSPFNIEEVKNILAEDIVRISHVLGLK